MHTVGTIFGKSVSACTTIMTRIKAFRSAGLEIVMHCPGQVGRCECCPISTRCRSTMCSTSMGRSTPDRFRDEVAAFLVREADALSADLGYHAG